MKRILIAFLCIVLFLTACGSTATGDLKESDNIVAMDTQTAATEQTASHDEAPTTVAAEPSETQVQTEAAAAEAVYPDVNEAYLVVLEQYWEAATMSQEDFSELYWNQADLESVLFMQEREPGYISEEELQHYYDVPRVETVFPYVNRYRLVWDCGYSPEETIPYVYTCYDIDGNGVEELLIGQGDETDAAIMGVFSVKDNALVVWERDIVDRARMTVYLDGTVCIDGSSSASLHSYHFYRVAEDGSGLEQIREFYVDYDDPNVQSVLDAVMEFETQLTAIEGWNWKHIVACS